jgi:1-acyl-sn-glycerol-3-phosphate acyltransferase
MNTLRGLLAITFLTIQTAFWCLPLYLIGLTRLAMPAGGATHRAISAYMERCVDGWVLCNRALFRVLRITTIDASFARADNLSRTGWFLILSNHQSWADILILQNIFLGLIPPLKFFTKRELIWVPMVGFAMWLLGFPYVRRYSREQLAKNPSLRDRDRTTTLRACDGFKVYPTSVLNFLEGTRFTQSKHETQDSPYRHLLLPKSGGLGYVAEALGKCMDNVLDVTIYYYGGPPTFWEFVCGQCPHVKVFVEGHGIPQPLTRLSRDGGREELKCWVDDIWRLKDKRIDSAKLSRMALRNQTRLDRVTLGFVPSP